MQSTSLVWLLALSPLLACQAERPVRPNVVLVTVDTLRADHLGCYGYARPTTPEIDRLCEQAVVFESALTPTPTTDPGHATIMTALHPSRHGVLRNGWKLADEHLTLAELLREAGYDTQAFVSVGHLSEQNGFAQGFTGFDDDFESKSISPQDVTDKAVRWLRGARAPFFLWVHYWDPHGPYAPPEEHDLFWDKAERRRLRVFTTGGRVPEGDASAVRTGTEARIVSLYDGEIHYTDSQVGRLLETLRDEGIDRRTLFVLTSDHGEMNTEIADSHGYAFEHGEYLFEPNVRVPLIVRLPGAEMAGVRVEGLVSNMDVAPTVLDGVGLGGGGHRFDGVSLLPLARGAPPPRSKLVLQRRAPRSQDAAGFHELALRTDTWKYIWDAESNATWLFDLKADPGERSDRSLVEIATHAQLAGELVAWRMKVAPVAIQAVSPEQQEALGYVQ